MRWLLLVATVAALLTPATSHAWCRMYTNAPRVSPQCIRDAEALPEGESFLVWERRCMQYSVDQRGSSDIDLPGVQAVARTSFDAWLAITCDGVSPGLEVTETVELANCQDAQYRRSGANVNTIAFVDDWPSRGYEPAAFAVTTVWHSTATGRIFDADIQVNERLGPYAQCPADGCPRDAAGEALSVDLQNVLTHEVGHFFGIAHSDVRGSTMVAISPRGETDKRIPRTDDVEAFCAVYPPGSLPSSCDPEPNGGLDLDCEDGDDGGGGCSVSAESRPAGTWFALLGATLALVLRRRS